MVQVQRAPWFDVRGQVQIFVAGAPCLSCARGPKATVCQECVVIIYWKQQLCQKNTISKYNIHWPDVSMLWTLYNMALYDTHQVKIGYLKGGRGWYQKGQESEIAPIPHMQNLFSHLQIVRGSGGCHVAIPPALAKCRRLNQSQMEPDFWTWCWHPSWIKCQSSVQKREMPETLVSWCLYTMFTSSKHSKTKKSTRQDHYEVDFFVAIGPEIVLNKLELLQKSIKLMNPAHSCTFLHNMHPIPHCQQKIHRKPPWNLMGFQQPGPVELSSKHWKFGNMEQPKHKETQDIETNKQLGIWTKTYAYKNKIN